ncbi:MAG: 30S ribosomal protein S12 methylthiotransferase RimO [Verrucomicrobiota bacterium]
MNPSLSTDAVAAATEPATKIAAETAARRAAATAIPTVKIGLVSLGCAKNLVDSEIMAGHLHKAGMALTPNPEEADVMIVNTCSFIDAAKEESIGAILEANRERGLRRRHHAQKLIVAGCMAQRFAGELRTSMPEVDAFIGLDQLTQVAPIIEGLLAKDRAKQALPENFVTPQPRFIPDFDTPRFRLTPSHTAYVKIAEGCNHPCSFCIIPQMRGRHRSRTVGSIVAEARQLVAEGVRELNLISQDTTYFGMDRWAEKAGPRAPVDSSRGDSLVALLRELQQVEGDFWIRLLYTHPAHWSDELIATIAECPKVARYVDMPLQHIADPMLDAMRRETSSQHIRDLIVRIRAGIPGIALRTTFIAGFPGETAHDFQTLLDFIAETRFERLGVFKYSREEGTRAAKRDGHLPARTKQARWKKAMALQRTIALEQAQAQVGRRLRVLVESPGVARSEADAPEVDPRVFVPEHLPAGQFAEVTVVAAREYDLVAG